MNKNNNLDFEKFIDKEEKLEGYVWDSNNEYPEVLRDHVFDFSIYDSNKNSYIVEALLYSKARNCSWIIKHTGSQHINKFDLNNLPKNAELVPVDYIPHRLKKNNPAGASSIERVCFQQLWVPENDSNCADMSVLKLQALIFTGFNHQPKLT